MYMWFSQTWQEVYSPYGGSMTVGVANRGTGIIST